MEMVGHQAKGKNLVMESLARSLENLVEAIAVPVVGENILTGISAKDYVVYPSRRVNARFACHG